MTAESNQIPRVVYDCMIFLQAAAQPQRVLNLAIAASARFLVTWNERHLTYLMRKDTLEGIDFCRRFPQIRILDPHTFVREIPSSST